MLDNSYHELLAQVATMYYEQEMTQNTIATELGLSRVKIYRLLKQAKAEHVVQIVINWPTQHDLALEATLKEQFNLKEALVLKTTSQHTATTLRELGQLSAKYLERILLDDSTMAVCLGRTSYETINAISPGFQARVRVAQAVGSMSADMQHVDSATLARELAQKLGGEVLYVTSPLMADSLEAAQMMRTQRDINQTLTIAKSADVALTGIGNLDPITSGFSRAGLIKAESLQVLMTEGAVGDIAGQIYRLDGTLHPCHYNQRVIGITFEQLKQIPTSIAVAMGVEKAQAILGGLRTGVFNVLCTDDRAASEVLKLN